MDTVNARKNKHLTEDDRRIIEEMLRDRATFREIAQTIGKDPSTILRKSLSTVLSKPTPILSVMSREMSSILPALC